jgi:hypothetical protein
VTTDSTFNGLICTLAGVEDIDDVPEIEDPFGPEFTSHDISFFLFQFSSDVVNVEETTQHMINKLALHYNPGNKECH